ncbi:hypothetical protein ACIRD8_00640 [Streptomyces sp. NPDC102451]|uniref:hypothetical protein n=1 Tax=Streptomyces sp. NPDC102451 TaxID=3366177 RepID=UPI0037FCC705
MVAADCACAELAAFERAQLGGVLLDPRLRQSSVAFNEPLLMVMPDVRLADVSDSLVGLPTGGETSAQCG